MGIFGKSKKKLAAAAAAAKASAARKASSSPPATSDDVSHVTFASNYSTSTLTPTYLIFGATGRRGRATIDALIAKGITSIVAATRTPASANAQKLIDMDEVTKVVKADMNDVHSLVAAIRESRATHIWFMTDYWSLPYFSKNREGEAKLGQNVVDAIVLVQERSTRSPIQHVVFASSSSCDVVPENIGHFWGKADVENYLKEKLSETSGGDTDVDNDAADDGDDDAADSPPDSSHGITWSILRSVSFFDNADDAKNSNSLTKGSVKMLTKEETKLQYVSCTDVGKAGAVLLTEPGTYKFKTIDAVADECSGTDLAKALSDVSGVECTYSIAMLRPALWLVERDLYNMAEWFESPEGGYTASIEEFKMVVPDAMDAKAWFASKGKWADGELFDSNKPKVVEVEVVKEEEASNADAEAKSEVEAN